MSIPDRAGYVCESYCVREKEIKPKKREEVFKYDLYRGKLNSLAKLMRVLLKPRVEEDDGHHLKEVV